MSRTPTQQRRLDRIITLRRIELMEMAASRDASRGLWSGLLQELPSDCSWISA